MSEYTIDSTHSGSPSYDSDHEMESGSQFESTDDESMSVASSEDMEPALPTRAEVEMAISLGLIELGGGIVPFSEDLPDPHHVAVALEEDYARYRRAVLEAGSRFALDLILLNVQCAHSVLLVENTAFDVSENMGIMAQDLRESHDEELSRLERVWRRRNYAMCRGKIIVDEYNNRF